MNLEQFLNLHTMPIQTTPTDYSIKEILRKRHLFDFEVFLPTKDRNLQRDYVWSVMQEQELILSMMIDRPIPPVKIIKLVNDTIQVIDGKQRLTALLRFIDNEFAIKIGEEEFYYNGLLDDFKNLIKRKYIRFDFYSQKYDRNDNPILVSDELKIKWFKLINFAGTVIEDEHLVGL